jgi:hypothetical protein
MIAIAFMQSVSIFYGSVAIEESVRPFIATNETLWDKVPGRIPDQPIRLCWVLHDGMPPSTVAGTTGRRIVCPARLRLQLGTQLDIWQQMTEYGTTQQTGSFISYIPEMMSAQSQDVAFPMVAEGHIRPAAASHA